MITLAWFFLAAFIAFVVRWLLERANDGSRLSVWKRAIVGLSSLLVSAILVSWLFDVPGELRFIRAMQSGDATRIEASQPHPIVVLDGRLVIGVFALSLIGLGVGMAVVPQRFGLSLSSASQAQETSPRVLLRFRVYGIVITVLGAALGGVMLLAPGMGITG